MSTPAPLPAVTELLLLADGTVLVHNLTPTVAALLAGLNLQDMRRQPRAGTGQKPPLPIEPA